VTEPDRPRKGGGQVRDRGARYAIKVRVDGKPLELKEFLHDVIGGAVDGMLGALRDVEAPRSITIDVTRL
jgi:hypothetical protein